MIRLTHYLKVFWPIISLVAVDMVDDLVPQQRTVEDVFHDDPMLWVEIVCISLRMRRVSPRISVSATATTG